MKGIKLETVVGVGLLIVAVVGFMLSVLLSLPEQEQVDALAQPLTEIPRDLFSSDNELTKKVRSLSTPNGVPVSVDPATVGRTNVFENF